MGLMHPPQLRTNVIVKHRYRFTSTSATPQTIVDNDVVGIAGAVCSVANATLNLIAASVKIHSIEIWSPPASQGSAATCSVEWLSTFSPTIEVSDTTVSVSEPAHIRASPPSGSAASFWINPASAQNIMKVMAPVGSIIDVKCTHLLIDEGTAGASYAVAAGTLGVLYYLPLDGASDVYLPTSLTTTT
jgi:hypothetical protein